VTHGVGVFLMVYMIHGADLCHGAGVEFMCVCVAHGVCMCVCVCVCVCSLCGCVCASSCGVSRGITDTSKHKEIYVH